MPRRQPPQAPEEFAEDWELLRELRRPGKSYVGRRSKNDRYVVKVVEATSQDSTTRALPLARNLVAHSHGFAWGYGGSGPAQLALAILADYLQDPEKAVRYHQKFKFMVIADLPEEGWELPESVVREAIVRIEGEENSSPPTG